MTFEAMLPTGDFVRLPFGHVDYLVRANNGVFYSGHANCFGNIRWRIADVPANAHLTIAQILGGR